MQPIDGHPGYLITRSGLIWSIKKNIFLKPGLTRGYYTVTLNYKSCRVNRLVATAYIPNPENKPEVGHLDLDPLNNHVDNLVWNTRSENIRHALHSTGRLVCDLSNGIFYDTVMDAAASKGITYSNLKHHLNGTFKRNHTTFTYC